MKYLLLILFPAVFSTEAYALEPIRIEVGKNYSGYSNDELRRRVWQLERAVAQLQDQVFQLALKNEGHSNDLWTCTIQSFGKTHVAAGNSKASALAQALKKCSDATDAIHCKESDVKCGNE